MQHFSTSPKAIISSSWRHRSLLAALTKREVIGRYRGSILGILWSFFNPLLMLFVYSFAFSVVFQARWPGGSASRTEFALILFTGLMVFNLFSECVTRAPALIVSNVNYVKKVVFPLEILPWVTLGSALFHLLISVLVWLLFYALFFGMPSVGVLLLPVALLPLMALVMGLAWFLASLGVFLRDVGQVIGVMTTALLFLSPIFYPVSMLPEAYQGIMHLNPLTPAVEQARNLLVWHKGIDWLLWGKNLAFSLMLAWLGFAWFQKTRKGFADVL